VTIDQQMATIITAIVSVIVGALVGGGAALVVMDRIVKSVLQSPVLIRGLEVAAQSWPAPVKELIHDTGSLLVKATDDEVTVTSTPGNSGKGEAAELAQP
jgi:hypothetical protein